MPKKRKSTANRQNIQIYRMKQKLKEEIAEKTRDALLDEQIEDLARESVGIHPTIH